MQCEDSDHLLCAKTQSICFALLSRLNLLVLYAFSAERRANMYSTTAGGRFESNLNHGTQDKTAQIKSSAIPNPS